MNCLKILIAALLCLVCFNDALAITNYKNQENCYLFDEGIDVLRGFITIRSQGLSTVNLKDTGNLSYILNIPTVRFPKLEVRVLDRRRITLIKEIWSTAHNYLWKTQQLWEQMDQSPQLKIEMWHGGVKQSKRSGVVTEDEVGPANWFGSYNERKFSIIKNMIDHLWFERFLQGFDITIVETDHSIHQADTFAKTKCLKNAPSSNIIYICIDHLTGKGRKEQVQDLLHALIHDLDPTRIKNWVSDIHTTCQLDTCLTKSWLGKANALNLAKNHEAKSLHNVDNYASYISEIGANPLFIKQLTTSKLYTEQSFLPPIKLIHKAAYLARFDIRWTNDKVPFHWSSGLVLGGYRKKLRIPSSAKNIIISTEYHSIFKQRLILEQGLCPGATYSLSGSLSNAQITVRNCH